ncbi:MAG: hypothetical protein PHV85_10330, partial [Desulfovibrionaceae bacterium]|nr:hypothetical protein [Desulfovibrionaceae bacterium]
ELIDEGLHSTIFLAQDMRAKRSLAPMADGLDSLLFGNSLGYGFIITHKNSPITLKPKHFRNINQPKILLFFMGPSLELDLRANFQAKALQQTCRL